MTANDAGRTEPGPECVQILDNELWYRIEYRQVWWRTTLHRSEDRWSKAGLVNLTRELAAEHGADSVRAYAICPGAVNTANWNDLDESDVVAGREQTHLSGFGEPEDVGDAAVFLASSAADWITGEALFVDGGWSAHR